MWVWSILVSLCLSGHVCQAYKLYVQVQGVRSDKGTLWVELLGVNEEPVAHQEVLVKEGTNTVVFDSLLSGDYAVRYFHDENENDQLDTNFVGIPKEGYGFSNDAHGTFGPYSFKKWLVNVEKDVTIMVNTKYL